MREALNPSSSTRLRNRRRRSGQKKLVQQAVSGELGIKRQVIWRMSEDSRGKQDFKEK